MLGFALAACDSATSQTSTGPSAGRGGVGAGASGGSAGTAGVGTGGVGTGGGSSGGSSGRDGTGGTIPSAGSGAGGRGGETGGSGGKGGSAAQGSGGSQGGNAGAAEGGTGTGGSSSAGRSGSGGSSGTDSGGNACEQACVTFLTKGCSAGATAWCVTAESNCAARASDSPDCRSELQTMDGCAARQRAANFVCTAGSMVDPVRPYGLSEDVCVAEGEALRACFES